MKSRKFKACILASTLLTGAGATGAFAQDQVDQGTQAATGSAADDVVVVTGSRIRQANLVSTSPVTQVDSCLLYTSPSPRDLSTSRMPSSA